MIRAAFLLLALASAWLDAAQGGMRRYTIEDQLKLEEVGIGRADASGRWFVWEQSFRYDSLGDYGMGALGTPQGGDYHLMAVDGRSGIVSQLFRPAKATAYRLGSFSPDGRHVSFLQIHNGEVSVGICDIGTRRVQTIHAAPRLDIAQSFEPTWLDGETIVFPAFPPGEGPWAYTFRRGIAKKLQAQWDRSWSGKNPSFDVQYSGGVSAADGLPGRLIKFNLTTSHLTEIASGQFESASLSSSGRYLAALRDSPRDQNLTAKSRSDWAYHRTGLVVFDLVSGRQNSVAQDLEVVPDSIAWEPNSSRLAFFAWRAGSSLSSGVFYTFDAKTGALVRLAHTGLDLASQRERGGPQWPERAVWLSGELAVFARKNDDGSASPRLTYRNVGSTPMLTPAHWYLLNASRPPSNITASLTGVSARPLYSDGRSLWVLASGSVWRVGRNTSQKLANPSDGMLEISPIDMEMTTSHPTFSRLIALEARSRSGTRIALLDCATGEYEDLPIGARADILAVSAKARRVLLHEGSGKTGAVVLQTAGGGEKVLWRLNRHLHDVAETNWAPFHYSDNTGSKNLDLVGCVLHPPDFVPGRRYPMIVDVYPNHRGHCGDPGYYGRYDGMGAIVAPYSPHLLAAEGYIVFQPDTVLVHESSVDGPLADLNRLVNKGVDALIAQGAVDDGRLGLMGFSQGGFASLWLVTQERRYRATVSVDGWADMYSEYFEQNMVEEFASREFPPSGDADRYLSQAGTDFGIGKPPSEAPLVYLNNSPLFRAARVSSPILMIGSDMDMFAHEQYQMMMSALYQNSVPAEFVTYRGEGHGPSSPANIRDMWKRINAWFDKYLDVGRGPDGEILWNENRASPRIVSR